MQKMPVWSLGGEDSLEKVNGNPLQYSCLEKSMDSGAWWAAVHRISKSRDWATEQQIKTKRWLLPRWGAWLPLFKKWTVQCSSVRPILCDLMDCSSQASLSITSSQSLRKLMSIESVVPSNHLILGRPLLLPSFSLTISVFSNESGLHNRWPKYWSFSFSISPSSVYSGQIFFFFQETRLFNKSLLVGSEGQTAQRSWSTWQLIRMEGKNHTSFRVIKSVGEGDKIDWFQSVFLKIASC